MENNIKYIGIDIGGSHTKIGLVTNNYNIINDESVFYGDINNNLKPQFIYEHIVKYINNIPKDIFINIKGIAIACPGMPRNNTIIGAVNLGGSSDILVKIQEKYSLPVYSNNDAICASFAQFKKGSLRNTINSIYIGLGTGVGFSVILNKQIFTINSLPLDLSHTTYKKKNINCSCGKVDCIEQYISIKALRTNLNAKLNRIYNISNNLKIEEILSKFPIEDYIDIINEYSDDFIVILTNLIELFKPDTICLGGGFVKISNTCIFENILNKYSKSKIFSSVFDYKKPDLVISTTLGCSEIIGAVLLLEDTLK